MNSQHPITDSLAVLHAALDQVGVAQAWALPPEAKKQVLRDLARAEARVTAMKLQVLALSADLAEESGDKDAGSWLARDQRLERRNARLDDKLASALDTRWHHLTDAFTAGAVNLDQVRVIARALDELVEGNDDLDPELVQRAEHTLIDHATKFGPRELRILGRRILEHLDPEGTQARDERRLRDAEAHANKTQRLSWRSLGDGTTRLTGVIGDDVAHRLETILNAFAQPRKQAAAADGKLIPRPRLMALAFRDLLERLDPTRIPDHGGDATTVVVTITLHELREGLGKAGLGFDPDGDDTHITPEHARRLACQAQIIPAVLGQAGEILDLGRASRLHTPAMRKAIRLRDKTCRADGCDIPATWCEIHHLVPWSEGGKTSVKDGVALCSHHHHIVHDPAFDHERHPDGSFRFYRRR
ncbi:hypothetical protein J2S59_001108 [Nocardioides massiliensis]|uniref:HNH nuclease domain-containing protein n=2 Tax=Nocardioides massiliensis TaxID=1325935 RepID=A0ABT9NLK6_9ACTN|nr:HNH endonuclease signature motif containing protein [Nocardioides massiliensis]MDP9821299.1 hypothetical protein [Nocardioides massiliensis]